MAVLARGETGEAWPPIPSHVVRTLLSAMGCHFLDDGEVCPHGCRRWNYVCHHFAKWGDCRYGDGCNKSHVNPRQRSAPGGTSSRIKSPPRKHVPRHIREALDRLNLLSIYVEDAEIINAVFKIRVKKTHPDRNPTASEADVVKCNRLTAELTQARDSLLEFLVVTAGWRGSLD